MQYINRHLPSESPILFIFLGNRGYYCDRNYVFDMNNNRSTLQKVVEKAQSSEGIVQGLKKMGITHLLLHSGIFAKWAKTSFDAKGHALLKGFFERHVRVACSRSGYALYVLKPLTPS
jgi:hypothetical protein